MEVTNAELQSVSLKNKIGQYFEEAQIKRKQRDFCYTKDVLATMMDKWSLFVIFNLGYFGTMRFGGLKTNIRAISSRMLSVTLKKLETKGVVTRAVFAEVPPRVEYRLTPFGEQLADKAVELNQWLLDHYPEKKSL